MSFGLETIGFIVINVSLKECLYRTLMLNFKGKRYFAFSFSPFIGLYNPFALIISHISVSNLDNVFLIY